MRQGAGLGLLDGSGSGSDGMHCFRQFRLRLRAPKGDRPGKNQPFFQFDFKICLHNKSYDKTRQNAFVSRIVIPLIRSSFGAGPPFLTASLKKWPARAVPVPVGSIIS